ncbi:TrlF family AAA-like ATPase [Klebsiella variicola]|uniref:TrlF family AAA-like ATPase n=1 Tax=Klebsiella variicola TaxID=244366 RepID=UPI001CC9C542|nr:AAA family ATPase [Klebsiella variicola]MDU5052098.1 DNA repair protein [Klebsiella variicola]HCA5411532.1 AAA family ATPase [Klebsiella variicola]HDK6257298.1 AAA family ATPase [Klebsiella variicola]HDK6392829.1 AAA family ATPase [Klebsiella variicola]
MKGSVWNKWDLHIHSPVTWQANGYVGQCDIARYVQLLGEKQLSLIAVTNYFYFRQNELEMIREEIARQNLNITVLGNVEFRLDQQNKAGDFINVHILFSDRISTERINEALSRFPLRLTDGDRKAIYCCEKSVAKSGHGVDTIVVAFSTLLEHLSASFRPFRDYLVAVCPNGYGGYRPDANGRSAAIATEIDRQGQMIFGGKGDREFFLRTDRYDGASVKPVFLCSDAHRMEDIGSRYTWVKALPTFEGLRQALLEPEARLRIGEEWLAELTPKAHFSQIDVEGTIFDGQEISFRKLSIPLSQDMVAIIGGRGTGKSLLLDALRSRFAGAAARGSDQRDVNVQHMSVELDKANGEKIRFDARSEGYEYLHVSQGEIKKLCQEPGLISDEIKKMLRLTPAHEAGNTAAQLAENLSAWRAWREFSLYRSAYSEPVNTRHFQLNIIRAAQEKIEVLTSDRNKALIETFRENSRRQTLLLQTRDKLTSVRADIVTTAEDLNARIAAINAEDTAHEAIPLVDLSAQTGVIERRLLSVQEQTEQFGRDNDEIIGTFREQGLGQDITGLLEKVHEYQRQTELAETHLREIGHQETLYRSGLEQRTKLAAEFIDGLLSRQGVIDTAFASLTTKPHLTQDQQALIQDILTDIRIYGQPHFDVTAFYNGMLSCLNRGRFRAAGELTTQDRLREVFRISSIDEFRALLANEPMLVLPECPDNKLTIEAFFWRDEYFNSQGPDALLSYLFSPEQIQRYLNVRAEFEYKGKTVEKLSAGQRGTFYVCLKLATDAFGSPFVFDQPEDDLDNEFIMHSLVPLFRKIKQYRQVIIVTHNANLVVNCDAEQVIIAANNDEVISYRSGALEYGDHGAENSMRKAICDVLEGGRQAFEAREQKYGMMWLNAI